MKQVIVSQKNIHKKPITGISVSKQDPNMFLTISEDQTMRLFDLRVDSSVKLFQMGQEQLQTANCILDDKVYGVKGDQILQFELRKEIFIKDFSTLTLPAEINNIAKFENNILANLDSGNSVLLEDFTIKYQLVGHENICFTGDIGSDIAFTAGFDCKIMAWNVNDGKIIKTTDLRMFIIQIFKKNFTKIIQELK